MENGTKEKLSVATVTDDLIGGVMVGVGSIGAAAITKVANTKLKVHPLIVAAAAIALGTAGRIGSNMIGNTRVRESLKDISSGFIAAGSVDAALKALDMIYPAWRDMLPTVVSDSLPKALGSGPYRMTYNVPTNFKKLNGPDSNILSGANSNILGAAENNSNILN